MVKQTIQIFCRIKPTKSKTGQYEIEETDGPPILHFQVPKDISEGIVNNKKELYKFRFEKCFDQKSKQDEIFDNVAKPVIDNVLQGYNGTLFAYGQTGSGKTFTITGGAERYIDRGIIPRTLSYIFDYYSQNPESVFTTHVSYLEIYNESGYDLLDPKHEAAKLEDLPKVSLMEDSDQNIHLKNLSTHPANNEEESLNLLFLGDTNRMIAETPMNQASTRSHCIFTIHITSRESGSATIRRAKLHLVDLAGSERVSKSGVKGLLLTEAKYINLSLHYLEQVIVCLSEKNRAHIPYRNSMMTSVLRDSLGGNCMTTMIATVSVEKKNIEESISTCRFAQRVALIKNDALLNEELDPKLMILRLKREVAQLKEELAMATGEQRTDALTDEDLERCKEAVKQYLEDTDPEAILDIGADMRKIQECYRLLKKRVNERPASVEVGKQEASESKVEKTEDLTPRSSREPQTYLDNAETKKLKGLIQQRDNEINILVNMLKKEKKRAAEAMAKLEGSGITSSSPMSVAGPSPVRNGHSETRSYSAQDAESLPRPSSVRRHSSQEDKRQEVKDRDEKNKQKILGDMSMGRQEAFEIFRRDYGQNKNIEENKHTLKKRYSEAKSLGEIVNQTRSKINKLKGSIEQHRMSRVMQGLVDPENPEPDEMEQHMRDQIEGEKAKYKEAFSRLRHLKTEIEHLQHLLEKQKVKLMKDFELWWAEQAAVAQEQQDLLKSNPGKGRTAWRTPPDSPYNRSDTTSSQSQSQSNSTPYESGRAPIPGHIRQSLQGGSTVDTSGYSSQESARSYKQKTSKSSSAQIPMTGDAEADADIMAFLKARQNVLKHAQQGNR